jgi:hypothetical protein
MQTITTYKANSGKVYDTEVEAELDDTLNELEQSLTMYHVNQTNDEEHAAGLRVIRSLMEMLERDQDWAGLVAEKIEIIHQLKRQMK